MKITWFANSPLSNTGYGIQTRLILPLLKQFGHEINVQSTHGHEIFTQPFFWNDIPIYGRGLHLYGQDVIIPHQRMIKSDILLSLMDAWVFELENIRQVRWVPWFPVDHDPIPPLVLEKVRYAFSRLVYSKFAEKQLQNFDLDCTYIPHGVDTKIFKPLPDKAAARKLVANLPADAFIVGMVAANKGYPSRKAFEENIAAFMLLKKKHSDAFLFLQTVSGERTRGDLVDLPAYCRAIGLQLGKDVMFCDQYVNLVTGFPDDYMVSLYNSFDVLLSVSRGEGFGIPILEAQSCGTPVITGDWTSMSEITFAGWKVNKENTTPDFTRQGSYQFIPHIGAIYDCLESAYTMRDNPDYSKRARDGAERYDISKVAEKYWRPYLEGLAEKIDNIEKLKKQVEVPVQTNALDVKEISI